MVLFFLHPVFIDTETKGEVGFHLFLLHNVILLTEYLLSFPHDSGLSVERFHYTREKTIPVGIAGPSSIKSEAKLPLAILGS